MLQKYMIWDSGNYHCIEDFREKVDSIGFICCGKQECDPGHRYGPNKRDYHLIHFIQSGKGTLKIGGKSYTLQKNDMFLLREGEEAWYEADMDDPWYYTWIGFIGHKSNLVLDESGFKNSNIGIVKDSSVYESYITEMMENNKLDFQSELKRNGLLLELCADLIREYAALNPIKIENEKNMDDEYVQQALTYITKNYSTPMKISELADEIGINRSYLSTIFTKHMGVSPHRYLMILRLERSKHLLLNTNAPIKNIGKLVGYSDQLTFCKMFKKNTGYSPSEFRKIEIEIEDKQ